MKHFFRLSAIFSIILILAGCAESKKQDAKDLDKLYPDESVEIIYHSDWTVGHYKERMNQFRKQPLNFGDIVFLGNSITEGGNNWGEKFLRSDVRNRGISGDVTDGVLARLDEIIYFKPKAVFILIGINDLFNMYYDKEIPSADYVGQNILKIAETIHKGTPTTRVYVQTILPTSEAYMKENINQANAILKAHTNDGTFELIDLNAAFSNSDGLIKTELTYDGTHLNDTGYALWAKEIEPLMKSL